MEPKNLGFLSKKDESADYERMRAAVMEEVKHSFKPEFINRIDETIVFRMLDGEALQQIADIQIGEVTKRCKEQLGIIIKPDETVREFIVKKGSDEKYGARPIRRAVQVHMEDLLAEEILNGKIESGDTAVLTVQGKEEPEHAHLRLRRVRKAKKS